VTRPHVPDGIRYPWEAPPEPGAVIEVAEGILWARLPLPMALDHVNVYILDDGASWVILDTGIFSKKCRALWDALLQGPLAGRPVTRVIATHHHPDHIGMAGWFQAEHGAELLATRTAWLMARMLTLDVQETSPPETLAFYQSAGMDPKILSARAQERPFNFADSVAPLPLGYTRLQDDDVLEIGGRQWEIRLGHGHAPEHVTLWSQSDAVILAGDQLLPSISPNIGVYATEPMADPVTDWLISCARFEPLARPDHLVLGGHKLPFTGVPMRVRQLIDNHHGALARLRDHLAEPRTAAECFAPLFKRKIGPAEYGLALVEAVAHVNHLYLSDQVRRWRRADGAWLYQTC